jgi:hypothetical protein
MIDDISAIHDTHSYNNNVYLIAGKDGEAGPAGFPGQPGAGLCVCVCVS